MVARYPDPGNIDLDDTPARVCSRALSEINRLLSRMASAVASLNTPPPRTLPKGFGWLGAALGQRNARRTARPAFDEVRAQVEALLVALEAPHRRIGQYLLLAAPNGKASHEQASPPPLQDKLRDRLTRLHTSLHALRYTRIPRWQALPRTHDRRDQRGNDYPDLHAEADAELISGLHEMIHLAGDCLRLLET